MYSWYTNHLEHGKLAFPYLLFLKFTLSELACSQIIGFKLRRGKNRESDFNVFKYIQQQAHLDACLPTPQWCMIITLMKWLQFCNYTLSKSVSIGCHSTICLSKWHVVISQMLSKSLKMIKHARITSQHLLENVNISYSSKWNMYEIH